LILFTKNRVASIWFKIVHGMNLKEISKNFESISSQRWKSLIEKELDKPLATFNWVIEPGLEISPFIHADDIDFELIDLGIYKSNQEWNSAEYWSSELTYSSYPDIFFVREPVDLKPFKEMNTQIRLLFDQNPRIQSGNQQEWIITNLVGLEGDMNADLVYQPLHYQIPGTELRYINSFFDQSVKWIGSPELAAKKMGIRLTMTDFFYLNIARIRAIYLIWLQKYGVPIFPEVSAITVVNETTKDPYKKLIALALKAASAAIGGATVIALSNPLEYATNPEERATGRRLALNIHQILKWEVGLNKYPDPAYGSFYIEWLTKKLLDFAIKSV
jgi:hypothetical protein